MNYSPRYFPPNYLPRIANTFAEKGYGCVLYLGGGGAVGVEGERGAVGRDELLLSLPFYFFLQLPRANNAVLGHWKIKPCSEYLRLWMGFIDY